MKIIVDTGWIVGFLDRRDPYHAWAMETAAQYPSPYSTCEAVLSEVHFLLKGVPGASALLRRMIEDDAFDVSFSYQLHRRRVHALLDKYEDRAMDFADACILCLAEILPESHVLTVDASDFAVYRMRRNQRVSFSAP